MRLRQRIISKCTYACIHARTHAHIRISVRAGCVCDVCTICSHTRTRCANSFNSSKRHAGHAETTRCRAVRSHYHRRPPVVRSLWKMLNTQNARDFCGARYRIYMALSGLYILVCLAAGNGSLFTWRCCCCCRCCGGTVRTKRSRLLAAVRPSFEMRCITNRVHARTCAANHPS